MMKTLEKALRNQLERTVREARDVAETAARTALEHLGVGEPSPFAHLSAEERELRRRLRIHSRQLGDRRNPVTEAQQIDRLVEETAYEHWNRMLFARFLAENNLLMYTPAEGGSSPDLSSAVPVTLAECADLASDEGLKSEWELAARLASRLLPQIFRADSPVFRLTLPPEHQQRLVRLVIELPPDVFTAADALGWVYQFWQAKKKEEVNASEVKIGARELPAVTQLFTEPYMVAFLLDNSLGAWWAARRLTEADLKAAKNEGELRRKASLPGVPLEYLRFVKGEDGKWTPAAGTFDSWPEKLSELKTLDPCCGSGHFLVAAFLMLVPMRMEQDRLSAREAVDRVLAENIHGLEIDQRCVELAAFSLAMTAWKYPQAGGYRALPELNVACAGLSISSTKEQWMAILEWQNLKLDLRFYFDQLYELFSKAPTLGSLINPHRFLGSGLLDEHGMNTLLQVLRTAAHSELAASEQHELGVVAAGLAKAADLLAERYILVATNVPYLGRGKQDDTLKEYIETQYPLGKADLATAFVLRCLEFCAKGGATALVTPQNWMFLVTYKNMRRNLICNRQVSLVAELGAGAFSTPLYDFSFSLSIFIAEGLVSNHCYGALAIDSQRGPEAKASALSCEQPIRISQPDICNDEDYRIVTHNVQSNLPQLQAFACSNTGLQTGDNDRFSLLVWETPQLLAGWVYFQRTSDQSIPYGGCFQVLRWENGNGAMVNMPGCTVRGVSCKGKSGVLVHRMGSLPATLFAGELFDQNGAVLIPKTISHLLPIWCFLSDAAFCKDVRALDNKVGVTPATLVKVPFDLVRWQKVATEKYPNGLPEPESDDPTQWLFHGRPEASTAPLQVAVARMLGYYWPAETDENMRLSKRARTLVKRCGELLSFADKDGIVCIPPVRGEASASDRLHDLLAAAYGREWSPGIFSRLLNKVGFEGRTLETWLRDGFFAQHCDLFHQRPFIWHIWDGLRDGFSALVNYHKLDRKNLETLIYTYLGDWIKRQKDDQGKVDGAAERLAAAETLKKRLELVLAGEAPYDIFVRWKPAARQPIGWEPDLNDGVRLNIRPFMSVPDIRKKGAGVLREKPKIDWKKDRGKEPRRPIREYPWFWSWSEATDFTGGAEFTGERFNDCHYSLDFKRRARREIGAEEKQS